MDTFGRRWPARYMAVYRKKMGIKGPVRFLGRKWWIELDLRERVSRWWWSMGFLPGFVKLERRFAVGSVGEAPHASSRIARFRNYVLAVCFAMKAPFSARFVNSGRFLAIFPVGVLAFGKRHWVLATHAPRRASRQSNGQNQGYQSYNL